MDRYSLQESIGADNEETATTFTDDEAKETSFSDGDDVTDPILTPPPPALQVCLYLFIYNSIFLFIFLSI